MTHTPVPILLVSILALLLAACSKDNNSETTTDSDPNPVLSISNPPNLTIEEEGGTRQIHLYSTAHWTAEVDTKCTGWCTLSHTTGEKGNTTLSATFAPNDQPAERNVRITFRTATRMIYITFTQKQMSSITTTTDKVEVDGNGGNIEIHVKANVTYQYTIDDICKDWIHPTSTTSIRTMESSTIRLTIDDNPDTEPRQGYLLLTSDKATHRVTIYQNAQVPRTVISQKEYAAFSRGDTLTIELQTNSPYTWQMPAVPWLQEFSLRSVSSFTHTLIVAPNESPTPRTALVIFQNTQSDIKDTVTITQMQKDALVAARSTYRFNADRHQFGISLNTSGTDMTLKVSDPWITYKKRTITTQGLPSTVYDYLFEVAVNTNQAARQGTIRFLTAHGTEQLIPIHQAGDHNPMKAHITFQGTLVSAPRLIGTHSGGSILWGDGQTDNIGKVLSHQYSQNTTHQIELTAHATTGITLPSLEGITSITIYTNDAEKLSPTEDLTIEKKEWQ